MTEVVTRDTGGTITQSVRYIYDVFDRRIGKEVDADGEGKNEAEIERYVYDGAHIALVFDGDGNLIRRYLHGPNIDQILASEDDNGEVLWALTDHQGTVRDLIDNTGTIVNHISYDSFGQVTSETNPDIDFQFAYTGRELDDETGLYYYRARYYDGSTGRFISEDPISFAGGDANLYRYVWNNSTNFIDPWGLVGAGFTGGASFGQGRGPQSSLFGEVSGAAGIFLDPSSGVNTGLSIGVSGLASNGDQVRGRPGDYVLGVIATWGPGIFITGANNIGDFCGATDTFTLGLPFITIQLMLGPSLRNTSIAVSTGSVYNIGISFIQSGPSLHTPPIRLLPPPGFPPILPPSSDEGNCIPNPDLDGFYCSPY